MKGLIELDDQKEVAAGKYQWDVVTGNSGGSINTLAVAAWPKGGETEML